jgi:hypothetical protein
MNYVAALGVAAVADGPVERERLRLVKTIHLAWYSQEIGKSTAKKTGSCFVDMEQDVRMRFGVRQPSWCLLAVEEASTMSSLTLLLAAYSSSPFALVTPGWSWMVVPLLGQDEDCLSSSIRFERQYLP